MKSFSYLLLGILLAANFGCETVKSNARTASASRRGKTWELRRGESEANLPTPDWWYARRDYNPNYMHWGKMRHPDASVKSEKWVLLNEDQCKAPHRSLGRVSADNGREYRFYGFFRANPAYEPASDEVCPVFVLQRWEPLYKNQAVSAEPASLEPQETSAPPPPAPAKPKPSTTVTRKKSSTPPAPAPIAQ